MLGLNSHFYRHFSRLLHSPCRLNDRHGEKLSPQLIGRLGEDMACHQLRADGRKLLYRNYRGPKGGEIDIVARDQDVLSFVEVKTRTSRAYGRPFEAVTLSKQELIERGANAWLKLLGTREIPWRFDVVEVILSEGERPNIHVINNAF